MTGPQLEDKPPIKLVGVPSPTAKGIGEAQIGGLGAIASAGSRAVEMMPHSADELLNSLHMKLHLSAVARARATWFGGRFYNRMVGERPDYIQLSGRHMGQVLTVLGLRAPDWVKTADQYLLRVDLAGRAYDSMRADAGMPPLKIG